MNSPPKPESIRATPSVSIIIPIFNSAQHLHACLDSARAQTPTDIEIICVDDGSDDHSGEILRDYASTDPRVKIVRHDTNRGEGAARNTGLRTAHGEYVFHLDADDSIPPGALKLLYDCAKKHDSEMVRGSFEKLFPDGRRELQQYPVPPGEIINTCIDQSPLLQQVPPSHCAYLYQREFLDRFELRYPEDLSVGLDLVALASALLKAQRVSILPDVVYHYYQSASSATRGSLPLRRPLDAIAARGRAVSMLREAGFESAALERLARWSFDIRRYWLHMPATLSPEQGYQVFGAFRALLEKHQATPWTPTTAHHHRYLLALILAGRDREAFEYLATDEARNGFSNPQRLRECLSLVLEVVPDDVGATRRLEKLDAAGAGLL